MFLLNFILLSNPYFIPESLHPTSPRCTNATQLNGFFVRHYNPDILVVRCSKSS